MSSFRTRLAEASRCRSSQLILACDYDLKQYDVADILETINAVSPYICAVKLNFHLLLPLGSEELSSITKTAHDNGLQTVADIKLNDIGNTNRMTADNLWNEGFDAVIVNPMMGLDGLKILSEYAHSKGKGVIMLCHMSAPEALQAYELEIVTPAGAKKCLYQLFLDWALDSGVDSIVVGATFPDIIGECAEYMRRDIHQPRPYIMSPGVGAQGGDAAAALSAGSDYLIVGRTILYADDPAAAALQLCRPVG